MRWLQWIFNLAFGCIHRHTTWPHRNRAGLDYVCCLGCGAELPYSLRLMSIVTREEQLAQENALAWKEAVVAQETREAGANVPKSWCSSREMPGAISLHPTLCSNLYG
jgi:hypothetical protein